MRSPLAGESQVYKPHPLSRLSGHLSPLFIAVLSVMLLSGCGSRRLEGRVSNLRAELSDMRALQAEQTTRIEGLSTRVRMLSGRIEELEFTQNASIKDGLNSLKKDVVGLRKRVPPPAIVPQIALEADEALTIRLEPEARRLFSNALIRIREGSFSLALSELQNLSRYARGAGWLPNVVFWMGVCQEGQGQTAEALSYYHQITKDYPDHDRAALALLRQGSVFVRLGDTKSASLSYKKLISSYPGRSEAAQAKERLKGLK